MDMSWIIEQKHKLRMAIMLGAILAFLGPWAFDRINVPAQYECSAPNIRLDGDFCGMPISGIRGFLWLGFGFFSITSRLLTGKTNYLKIIRELLTSLLLLLPLLPIFSMLFSTLRPPQQHQQILRILPWVLAIGVCIFWSWNLESKQLLASWGLWSYILLAATAFVLEIAVLLADRKQKALSINPSS